MDQHPATKKPAEKRKTTMPKIALPKEEKKKAKIPKHASGLGYTAAQMRSRKAKKRKVEHNAQPMAAPEPESEEEPEAGPVVIDLLSSSDDEVESAAPPAPASVSFGVAPDDVDDDGTSMLNMHIRNMPMEQAALVNQPGFKDNLIVLRKLRGEQGEKKTVLGYTISAPAHASTAEQKAAAYVADLTSTRAAIHAAHLRHETGCVTRVLTTQEFKDTHKVVESECRLMNPKHKSPFTVDSEGLFACAVYPETGCECTKFIVVMQSNLLQEDVPALDVYPPALLHGAKIREFDTTQVLPDFISPCSMHGGYHFKSRVCQATECYKWHVDMGVRTHAVVGLHDMFKKLKQLSVLIDHADEGAEQAFASAYVTRSYLAPFADNWDLEPRVSDSDSDSVIRRDGMTDVSDSEPSVPHPSPVGTPIVGPMAGLSLEEEPFDPNL